MLAVDIPGGKRLRLEHLVLDYNGTLACDGAVIEGVGACLERISRQLRIHVLTADTFGTAAAALNGLPCELSVLPQAGQDTGKLSYVEKLGNDAVAAIGNGRNDRLMLKAAALGIAVIQRECAAMETLSGADVIAPDIVSALELLLYPLRLVATLRT